MRFCHHRESKIMPKALIAVAMTLTAKVKEMPGTGLDGSNPLLVESFANAERCITFTGHAARERLDEANAKVKATADEKPGANSLSCDSHGAERLSRITQTEATVKAAEW